MIWGAIGLNFKSKLMFIDGTVTSDYYFNEILIGSNVFDDADKVYGKGRWVFQQDNARPHISNETLMSLDYLEIPFIDDWPPYSPDLNVIEVVWAIMKKRIQKKKLFMIDDFKYEIIAVWNNLSFQTINLLIRSVLSHQMVFFECLLSKSRRPFQFILTFCIRTEKVEQK